MLRTVQETAREQVKRLSGPDAGGIGWKRVNEQDPSLVTGRLSNNTLVHFPAPFPDWENCFCISEGNIRGFYFLWGNGGRCAGMPKGLKIWLWIVLFMDVNHLLYYWRASFCWTFGGAACMIPELQITGVSILLFCTNADWGFILSASSEVVILRQMSRCLTEDSDLSLINSVVVPLVIYALMKPLLELLPVGKAH